MTFLKMCQKIEDGMRSALRLGYPLDVGDLESLSKYLHCVRRREYDAKTILYPQLHLPPDIPYHLWGAF